MQKMIKLFRHKAVYVEDSRCDQEYYLIYNYSNFEDVFYSSLKAAYLSHSYSIDKIYKVEINEHSYWMKNADNVWQYYDRNKVYHSTKYNLKSTKEIIGELVLEEIPAEYCFIVSHNWETVCIMIPTTCHKRVLKEILDCLPTAHHIQYALHYNHYIHCLHRSLRLVDDEWHIYETKYESHDEPASLKSGWYVYRKEEVLNETILHPTFKQDTENNFDDRIERNHKGLCSHAACGNFLSNNPKQTAYGKLCIHCAWNIDYMIESLENE